MVLDEAQEIKNPKTKLALAVKGLRTRMRVCLTGTPLENHVGDLRWLPSISVLARPPADPVSYAVGRQHRAMSS